MKREFPILYEKASVWIAIPFLWVAAVFYAQKLYQQPTPETYSVGITAFGVTAALSGICFAMAPVCDRDSHTAKYAGEKFLHASLLLVQSFMVLYIRDAALTLDWIHAHPAMALGVKLIAMCVLLLVITAATWTWQHGLAKLNALLWANWKRRIQEINA
ncbi:MAG TPA: hypothetical protein VKV15_01100, partial [Bryobacteraceae bacterium]|nr:hypothetical protein [Bryobacteraceae bacterium]